MKHSSIRQPLGAVKRSLQQGGGILAAFSVASFRCIDHFPTFKVILYFTGVGAVIYNMVPSVSIHVIVQSSTVRLEK